MIYEVRTYDLRPGTLQEVIKRFGDAYGSGRENLQLSAFWYTEIGPLNQIIHVWAYENLEERTRIRAARAKDPNWPPKIQEFLAHMESEIYIPFPFSPALKPAKLGPVYEMRSYFVKPAGGIKATMERWEKQLPKRIAVSPLAFVGHTELGPLNKYIHIWPYESLSARSEIRKRAVDTGAWPPPGGADTLVSQQNKIMLPAPFSPMQ
jgi:NIPSNAP